jgi:hypothetical protein
MKMAIAADSSTKPALATTFVALEAEPEPEPEDPPEEVPISLDGAAVATPFTPPVTAPWSVSTGALLPRAMAAAWKLEKVFPVAGALILPTIPRPQCETCLQWNQMGFVSVILIVNVEEVTRPESNPAGELELLALAAKYVHGAANEDWVTEWGTLDGK